MARLRKNSLFQDPTSPTAIFPQESVPTEKALALNRETLIEAPRSPQHARLRELLESPPSREDYKPDLKRKIVAAVLGGLTGLAHGPIPGIKVAQGVTGAPYNQAMQGYESQLDSLRELAEINKGTYKDQSDIYKANVQYHPDIAGQRAEKIALGTAKGKAPSQREERAFEIGKQHQEQRFKVKMQEDKQKQETLIQNQRITSAEGIARLNRGSRENIAANSLAAKERNAEKLQRIPPNQQAEAAIIASNNLAFDAEYPMTKEQREAIFEENNDGYWVLKNETDIDPDFTPFYQLYKELYDIEFDEVLNTSFDPSREKEEEGDEDEWVPIQ